MSVQSKAVTVPMSEVRPTVSRSDVMSLALLRRGVTPELAAERLHGALNATISTKRASFSDDGHVKYEDIDVPDWKSRLKAVEVYFKAMGFEFQAEKMQEGGVTRDVYMLVKNMTINGKSLSEASVEELEVEHKRAVEAGVVEPLEG